MNSRIKALPVVVISGFLGSGKTSLINAALTNDKDLNVAVIVNEFGAISIDHHLIKATTSNVIELANGCICCSIREDLLTTIKHILANANSVDYLIVETTGLADPIPIIQTLLHASLENHIRLDALVTLVDAANYEKNMCVADVVTQQIRAADLLIVTKADLVRKSSLKDIEKHLLTLNPQGRVVCSSLESMPLGLLFDPIRSNTYGQTSNDHTHDHTRELHRLGIESFIFTSPHPLEYRAVERWIKNVPAANILRGKGLLNLKGRSASYVFHLVGARCSLEVNGSWDAKKPVTEIVIIGWNLNHLELAASLEQCVVDKRRR